MKKLIVLLIAILFFCGCATSTMKTTKTMPDGSQIKYEVVVNSLFQDFSGSDLKASLDPAGKTTIKAGAVDNTASQVSADIAASMVELVKAMLPYLAPTPVSVP